MVNGKRVSKVFSTKEAAEDYRRELSDLAARGMRLDSDTLGAVTDAWLTHVQATKDASTYDAYKYALTPFASLAAVSVDQINALALQNILDALSGRRAQLAHDKLRQCIRWAIPKDLCRRDITTGLDRPKHERKKIEPFTVDEVALILKASKHLQYHAAIRWAQGFAGVRSGVYSGRHGTPITVVERPWGTRTRQQRCRFTPI